MLSGLFGAVRWDGEVFPRTKVVWVSGGSFWLLSVVVIFFDGSGERGRARGARGLSPRGPLENERRRGYGWVGAWRVGAWRVVSYGREAPKMGCGFGV